MGAEAVSRPQPRRPAGFTRNGEAGVHLAYSRDGIAWLPLNHGRPVIRPEIVGDGIGWHEWGTKAALMRDPCILRAPDGVFHMVWTIAWNDHGSALRVPASVLDRLLALDSTQTATR